VWIPVAAAYGRLQHVPALLRRQEPAVLQHLFQRHSLMRVQPFQHETDLFRKMPVILCLGSQGLQLGGALDPVEEEGPEEKVAKVD
jgi:hypothetical protein